jgi:DNA-binding response OmpR family regulator
MRILVVDDEVRLAEAVARGLRAEGFEVDVVHDGNDGLWRAREGTYAAIVLDVLLPGTNGYAVCRTLRREGNAVPILMLTAKDGEFDEVEAFELGADDFLAKPFSFPVLVARLRSLVRRGPAPSHTDHIEVDDLVLDPRAHTCRCAGSTVELTPREYDLLEALARRAGDVVAKAQLVDEVWGLDFDGDPNVVEVYVGYLRRKIDRPFDRHDLETVRGVGYRIGEAPGG